MMIASGSIYALVALVSLLVGWRFVRSAARADGRVIQMVEREGEHGKLYAPVFVFRDSSGAEHTVHSDTASDPPEHQVGDTVHVLYLPESPQDAKTDRFFFSWGTAFCHWPSCHVLSAAWLAGLVLAEHYSEIQT